MIPCACRCIEGRIRVFSKFSLDSLRRSIHPGRPIWAVVCALLAIAPWPSVPAFAAECVVRGAWSAPGPSGTRPLASQELIGDLARRSAVLLGERHDSAEHHRWQLQVITALHALRPDMVIGLEMFPRRVQPALDRWIAGAVSEADFLRESDWREVWQTDPQLYLPIFHFARMNRIPLIALNVERKLTHAVGQVGFDAIPVLDREGIARPAAPSAPYVAFLHRIFLEHGRDEQARAAKADASLDDPEFRHFVESQLVWDRAMAQGIAGALTRKPAPLVIGVMGGGHIANRYGVPHQLEALGVSNVAVLLPWDRESDCELLVAGYADAVFGVSAPPGGPTPRRQRLGVALEPAAGGVRIVRVEAGSVAESTGLRAGDTIIEVAGLPAKQPGDVARVVQRHAPGTWLPLKVNRGADAIELVAKFPPLEQ
jgi:uncharacterized iron-regulated protein